MLRFALGLIPLTVLRRYSTSGHFQGSPYNRVEVLLVEPIRGPGCCKDNYPSFNQLRIILPPLILTVHQLEYFTEIRAPVCGQTLAISPAGKLHEQLMGEPTQYTVHLVRLTHLEEPGEGFLDFRIACDLLLHLINVRHAAQRELKHAIEFAGI